MTTAVSHPKPHIETHLAQAEPARGTGLRKLIIIPALNEEESIGQVIRSVQQALPDADILVVDDGSSDATARLAHGHGARVASLPYNLGIGSAVQTGFLYAREGGYDVAVQVDGDGQHQASEIKKLLAEIESGQADVAVGSRFVRGGSYSAPAARRLGIIILAGLISLIAGQPITDPTSGFRASGRRAIDYCARYYPFDYPEPEAIVALKRAGLRIREVPVEMRQRAGGQSSITPLRSAYYMVKVILSILITLLRQRVPAVRPLHTDPPEEKSDVHEHHPH